MEPKILNWIIRHESGIHTVVRTPEGQDPLRGRAGGWTSVTWFDSHAMAIETVMKVNQELPI